MRSTGGAAKNLVSEKMCSLPVLARVSHQLLGLLMMSVLSHCHADHLLFRAGFETNKALEAAVLINVTVVLSAHARA